MHYFVTGATGFIGKRLVQALLQRKGSRVSFLVRECSAERLAALHAFWGLKGRARERAVPVIGDLTAPRLGLGAAQVRAFKDQVDALFHLGAVYDLAADKALQVRVNVQGTKHLVDFANTVRAGHLHHVSSIAAAGLYEGVFHEDMFEQARGLSHPYFMTKHESEKVVRRHSTVPWTVYRPALVVGDSRSGEIDKIDGPYYFFKLIQRMRQWLPPWMPGVGIEGGRINIVPVDYVVRCIEYLSRDPAAPSGRCFHVVDPHGYRVGELLSIFGQAAHAPKISLFLNAALLGLVPGALQKGLLALAPVQQLRQALMKELGLPEDIFTFLNFPTRYDRRQLDAALQGSGIQCPDLHDYAWVLWDYWERRLDPDLFIDRSLKGTVAGQVVLVTGGSSGIGLAAAHLFAQAGATTLICGRDPAKLDQACAQAQAQGYRFTAYAVDLADAADCERFLQQLQQDHGGVDFLINNAGRSIRRAIENSFDRFHDYERTMQLNYFGCLRLTLGLLPGMVAKKKGHVVNISSIGVLTNAPRFSAYVASKAALDAWTRCAAAEFADQGVTFTTVNMPLVRTPMIAPTTLYNQVPALTPEEAAALVAQACIAKPVRVATRLGQAGQLLHLVLPGLAQRVMNWAFRLFPDSAAARGEPLSPQAKGKPERTHQPTPTPSQPALSAEALAVQQLLRGIHF